MAIVSSNLLEDVKQADGRRRITERHLDQLGEEYLATYLADISFDVVAAMTARALSLYADKIADEISSNIQQVIKLGSLAVTVIRHSTVAQNIAALRVTYKTATKTEVVMIGDFLSSLTDAQLKNIFSMTQTQVNNLRTNRLTPAATLATSIRNSAGE